MNKFTRVVLYMALCMYIILLTQRILFKYPIDMMVESLGNSERSLQHSNFVPFDTIHFYLFEANVNTNIIISNLIGNVIGFIPFGILVPLVFSSLRSLKRAVAAAFGLSLTYECLQFLLVIGSFDVDDLILNTLGGLIGYVLILPFLRKLKLNKDG